MSRADVPCLRPTPLPPLEVDDASFHGSPMPADMGERREDGTNEEGRDTTYIKQRSAADMVVDFGTAVAEADIRSTSVSLGLDRG